MIASHLALPALSLIVVVRAPLVMALAAAHLGMAGGSMALALGVGYRFLVPAPQVRWPARNRRPLPRWADAPAPPLAPDDPRWTQEWPIVPPPSQIPTIREQAAAVPPQCQLATT